MYRIAVVTPYGAEPRLDHYAEFLLSKSLIHLGHSVRFYTYRLSEKPTYSRNSVYQGVFTRRCRQWQGLSPSLFCSILFTRPQIVILFHPRNFLNFSAYLAARLVGARVVTEIVGILHDPFIVTDTDDPIPSLRNPSNLIRSYRQFIAALLHRNGRSFRDVWLNFIFHYPTAQADEIVAISRDEQAHIKTYYNRPSTLIPWAIPNHELKEPQTAPPGASPLSCGDFLLFLGQMKRRKGWDTALEAIASLKQKGHSTHLAFVSPSQEVTQAQNYAKHLGITDLVHFFLQISNEEKAWLFANARYVLVPSRYEGFGLPVFEAFQACKPILVTDIPVFMEFVTHGKNAMVSPRGNGEIMAQNIIALDTNLTQVATLVTEGKKTAAAYSVDRMTTSFLELFQRLLA